jgi:hypothetical protein
MNKIRTGQKLQTLDRYVRNNLLSQCYTVVKLVAPCSLSQLCVTRHFHSVSGGPRIITVDRIYVSYSLGRVSNLGPETGYLAEV